MTELNHTIVACRNQEQSASFLADVLGRAAPKRWGPFHVVELDNSVSLDYYESTGSICSQHYAFLITEEEFDAVLARVRAQNLTYWADPGRKLANRINNNDGGRGFYFQDPNGHLMEVITRPYGSG
jgi:catechol 2,3-dioxygenase-like lactoylglutathione lyase family enzyme